MHFDRDMSSSDMCAIVVNNIEEHHEGKQADHSALAGQKSCVNWVSLKNVVMSCAGNWRCEFEVDNIDYEAGEPVMIRDRVRLMARGWRYP